MSGTLAKHAGSSAVRRTVREWLEKSKSEHYEGLHGGNYVYIVTYPR